MDWTELPFTVPNFGRAELGERPAFFDSMLDDASSLFAAVNKSVRVSFLRVDFFEYNSSYVFAEFKFHPQGCNNLVHKAGMVDKFYGFVATHPHANMPSTTRALLSVIDDAV